MASQTLPGHVPRAIGRLHLQPLRNFAPTNQLSLGISLPLRNEAGLGRLLQQIYDPASTNYHHYLTPGQFTAQFGPSEQDYDTVINYLKTHGLTVTTIYSNRTLVDVRGDVTTINNAFHVTLREYQHPIENRTFFAPDTDPVIDAGIPISHVTGLDDLVIPRPLSKIGQLGNNPSKPEYGTGSGPVGQYLGNDFRAAYVPGVTLDGKGQNVALFELDAYYTSDITNYEQACQPPLPNLTITNISVNGGVSTPGGGDGEVSLDIEVAISMATNLSKVLVYEAPNGSGNSVIDLLQRIANDDLAKQISSSWGLGDSSSYDTYYQQMALQGQSFFQASGDDGAFYPTIAQWSDDTNITLVGGTTLNTTGAGGSWSSESAWNWYIDLPPNTNSTGGGTNFNGIPIPSWQQGIDMTANQGSPTLRNVPDVALTADNVYVYYNQGNFPSDTFFGGTSCAAPLWAAFTALVNEQATNYGLPPVGFINPAVYAIGKSAAYTSDFHDITSGNNTNSIVTGAYFAVPGYDLCTGWGTPNGQNLINTLAPSPDPLVVIPSIGYNASGFAGGPFNPNSQIFTLTNSAASLMAWSLINTSAWLSASSTAGSLAANGTTNITISLSAVANNLPDGTSTATIAFTNSLTNIVNTLPFAVQAVEPLAISPSTGTASGFAGGPFSPNSQNYTLTNNSGDSPFAWSLINTSAWLNVSATSGSLPANGTASVIISVNAAADLLPSGTNSATLTLSNGVTHITRAAQFNLQIAEPLIITPTVGFTAAGPVGGPFSAISQSFSLTNAGMASLTWAATNSFWLNVSPASGALSAGAAATVTASLNLNASNLPSGVYTGQVSFMDEPGAATQNCPFTLSIGQNLVQNGGFETGSFSSWTLYGTTTSGNNIYNAVVNNTALAHHEATNLIHSGTYGAALGESGDLAYLYQSLATVPGQTYLLSFWLNNYGGDTPNQFQVNWNTNFTATNTVFNQVNMGTINYWTNMLFLLPATGTNTTLQFGARNDNYFFGLDDIYVWPVPSPTIRQFSKIKKSSYVMTWYAQTSAVYQVQYSTNLGSTNWFTLNTYTATNSVLTVTNSISTNNPTVFFRIIGLP